MSDRVGARPVIVALAPGGQPEMRTFFDMFDIWIRELSNAAQETDRPGPSSH